MEGLGEEKQFKINNMKKILLMMVVLLPFLGSAQFEQVGQTLQGIGLNVDDPDLFGYNVALSDDGATMAVAALASDLMIDGNINFGAINYIQVFRMTDGQWQQIGNNILGVFDAQFGAGTYSKVGKSLALSGDGNTMVVGETSYRETLEDGTYINQGRVRVFRYENENWSQVGNDIFNISGYGDPGFGEFVDINNTGEVIAIGNPYEPLDNYPQFGSVQVYQNVNDEWIPKGDIFYGENPNTFLGYGVSLSADGNRMAVGLGDGPMIILQAYVNIYDFSNGQWNFVTSLSREFLEEEYSYMSFSLSDNGKRLAIGNSGMPDFLFFPTSSDSHYGHITIFEENEQNEWINIKTIDGEYFEFLGLSVDLSRDGKILSSSPFLGNKNKIFQEVNGEWNVIGNVIKGSEEDTNTYKVVNSRDGSVVAFGNFLSGAHGEAYAYQDCELSEINISPGENSITCKNGTALLSAQIIPEYYAANGSVRWYDSEEATTPIFIGNEFETPTITENTIFWVEAVTAGGCSSQRIPMEVALYPTPEIEIVSEPEVCEGESTTIVVSSEGNSVNWFDSEMGTESIYSGFSFETPILTETTSYWVEATSADGCVSERLEITITVNPIPELTIETILAETCEGSIAVLSASSDLGEINWYTSEDGTEPVFTGTSYETPELLETTSFWVEAANGGCKSERQEIVVTVNPAPVLEAETEYEICLGSDAYLYAYSEENVIFWYAGENDIDYVYHGNNFIVEGLTETTFFWVEAFNLQSGCLSDRIPVTIHVNPVSELTAETTEFAICAGNTATLTATSNSTVNWYDSFDGTEAIYTGEAFTTPALTTTTQYWAEAVGEGECASQRIEFTVIVSPSPEAPEAVFAQLYVEGMTLADFDVESTGTLTWYADEALTTVLPETTPVVLYTIYYVTQTVGDCESEATEVMADEFLNAGNQVKDDFAYYPNPVKDKLYFKGSEKVKSVQIFDMSGRLLLNKHSETQSIMQTDITMLGKGSYIVRVQTDQKERVFKIIKN